MWELCLMSTNRFSTGFSIAMKLSDGGLKWANGIFCYVMLVKFRLHQTLDTRLTPSPHHTPKTSHLCRVPSPFDPYASWQRFEISIPWAERSVCFFLNSIRQTKIISSDLLWRQETSPSPLIVSQVSGRLFSPSNLAQVVRRANMRHGTVPDSRSSSALIQSRQLCHEFVCIIK